MTEKLLKLEFKSYFENMICEIKDWAKFVTDRINEHNKKLLEVSDEVLMTFEKKVELATK